MDGEGFEASAVNGNDDADLRPSSNLRAALIAVARAWPTLSAAARRSILATVEEDVRRKSLA
jgi:hypothetical protein